MPEHPQINVTSEQPPDRGQFSFALTVAAAAMVIVLGGLYFWPGRQSPSRGTPPTLNFSFGPPERAYARKIHIENVELSRAENFLHQEVTTLSGEIVNTGDKQVRAVQLTVEFSDQLNQVVLRESHAVSGPATSLVMPGDRRSFDVSFEHIPADWNMRPPAVFVTGIIFK